MICQLYSESSIGINPGRAATPKFWDGVPVELLGLTTPSFQTRLMLLESRILMRKATTQVLEDTAQKGSYTL